MQSNFYVFKFMAIVCLTCAFLVSGAATVLKNTQDYVARIDNYRNVLKVVGAVDDPDNKIPGAEIEKKYKELISLEVVNGLGEKVEGTPDELAAMVTQAKLDEQAKRLVKDTNGTNDFSKLEKNQLQELRFPIYLYKEDGKIASYCFPIFGRGLWSTLYGYLALETNADTVRGITFYKHGETPGLGGEIDKPWFQKQFKDKEIVGPDELGIAVAKPGVAPQGYAQDQIVSSISGATITSKGVQSLIKKCMQWYAPYFVDAGKWKDSKADVANIAAQNTVSF